MAKKLQTPCSAPKRGLPCEFKLDYAMGGYLSLFKGWLYVVREEFGADTALRLYEKIMKMDDRVKNLTNTLLKAFKIERNDAETIAKWIDIYYSLAGFEYTWLERSKTIAKVKITKCLWKTEYKDISD
jgi:hypothetical protein